MAPHAIDCSPPTSVTMTGYKVLETSYDTEPAMNLSEASATSRSILSRATVCATFSDGTECQEQGFAVAIVESGHIASICEALEAAITSALTKLRQCKIVEAPWSVLPPPPPSTAAAAAVTSTMTDCASPSFLNRSTDTLMPRTLERAPIKRRRASLPETSIALSRLRRRLSFTPTYSLTPVAESPPSSPSGMWSSSSELDEPMSPPAKTVESYSPLRKTQDQHLHTLLPLTRSVTTAF